MRLLILASALLVSLGVVPSAMAWTWPLGGPVLRPYSLGPDAYAAGQHRGIDVGGTDGEPVRAPASGTVSFVGVVPSSGRTVTIQLEGYAVSLTHLGATSIGKGASVTEGDPIGTAGTSEDAEWPAPYVHLGVRVSSAADGYVDPLTLLPPRPVAAPPPTPPDAVAPSTAPVIGTGSEPPAVRAEPAAPRTESPATGMRSAEPRSPEPRSPALQAQQSRIPASQAPPAPVPAPAQGAATSSTAKPVRTTAEPARVSTGGQASGTALPIAADPVTPVVEDAHAAADTRPGAPARRASSPAPVTEPTGSGRVPLPTTGTDGRAGSTTTNVVRATLRPVAASPATPEVAREDTALRNGRGPAVVRPGDDAQAQARAVEQDATRVPPVQSTGTIERHAGRSGEGSAPVARRGQPPLLAEVARERVSTVAEEGSQPAARVRIWLAISLLLLLGVVGGGRWLGRRGGRAGQRRALLRPDVRVP